MDRSRGRLGSLKASTTAQRCLRFARVTPSDQTNAADNDAALRLMNGLADPGRRPAAAAVLAAHWGVDAVLILIRDQELGILRPAPGFRQTLPGGPTWRALFARCETPGMVRGEVAFPDQQT